ncbi:MAG: sensor histidine kinase [Oscillospiraceae bacterium]
MKRNGSYLRQYLPWLGLLLGVDALAALLLWLADARAFVAMTAVIVLATVFLFAGVCAVLCARSKRREQAFMTFLTAPDAEHEQALCRLLSANEAQSVHLLGETLRAQQQAIAQLQTQMDDYENYVELWAHEVKTPLALLTLVLDNRRDTLPEAVGFKLDYVRNRMQAFIDQMLYYARLRGARRDYRFERLTLRGCIDEVLDDYRPLLEEKGFRVEIRLADETVFADRRGLCFLLGQVVSNSVKYALEKPVLTFSLESGDAATVLSVRDNGPGVRACDLPYVFEKGFTGDSGHEKNKATGMGLYLAREVAKDLGLTLTAASDWGAGFEVRVTFPVVEE